MGYERWKLKGRKLVASFWNNSYKEDTSFYLPEATATMLEEYKADAKRAAREDVRAYERYAQEAYLAATDAKRENERLRWQLEWLMKQPALQHYAVQLELGAPVAEPTPVPEFK